MNTRKPLASCCLAIVAFIILFHGESFSQIVLFEDFEGAAESSWENTIFSDFRISGGEGAGVFETSLLSNVSYAPSSINLSISKNDNDYEGRYYEAGTAISHSYAILSEGYSSSDQSIEGFVSLCAPQISSPPAAYFCLRTNPSNLNGYIAGVRKWGGDQVQFFVARQWGGIVSDFLSSSSGIPFDFVDSNIYMKFEAENDLLVFEAWNIDFQGNYTQLIEYSINDTEFSMGVPAVSAFARMGTSVLFDDITVVVPEPTTILLLSMGGLLIRKRK